MKIKVGRTYKDLQDREFYVESKLVHPQETDPVACYLVWGSGVGITTGLYYCTEDGQVRGIGRQLLPNTETRYIVGFSSNANPEFIYDARSYATEEQARKRAEVFKSLRGVRVDKIIHEEE